MCNTCTYVNITYINSIFLSACRHCGPLAYGGSEFHGGATLLKIKVIYMAVDATIRLTIWLVMRLTQFYAFKHIYQPHQLNQTRYWIFQEWSGNIFEKMAYFQRLFSTEKLKKSKIKKKGKSYWEDLIEKRMKNFYIVLNILIFIYFFENNLKVLYLFEIFPFFYHFEEFNCMQTNRSLQIMFHANK